MGKKIALNVFYNLGIILCIFGTVWGYNNQNYPVIVGFLAAAALFLYLKIKLIKGLKDTLKK